MANTIPGGFYIGANGQPHDANGNPIDLTKLTQDELSLLPAEVVAEHEKPAKSEKTDSKPAKK